MRRTPLAAAALVGLAALASAEPPLTCDPQAIDLRSYRLATEVQGRIVNGVHVDWRDYFDPGRVFDKQADMTESSVYAAERAREIDPGNQMAWALLAREYLVLLDGERAEEAWARVLDAGAAVVWTATLYDVDARSYFVMAFDRRGIRVYRFGQIAVPLKQRFGGIPEFPGPENERFWAALGGCLDPSLRPEAEVAWPGVREIKAGNWVLWFKLTQPVTISSDRGKRKTVDEIKVNLHGGIGSMEVYKPVGEDQLAVRGRGPAGYNDLVRRTMVKFVDPEKRIALPPVKPSAGW